MSNEQIRETLAAGKKFIDGDWDEDYPDEHEWREHLPFGYAADGVRVRSCKECGLSLVFNLDSQKDALIEGGEAPIQLCGEPPQPRPWTIEVNARYELNGVIAPTEEEAIEAVEEFISMESLTVPVRLDLTFSKYSPEEIEMEAWEE
tara:strand:- start:226 stop:666 length:441 start_codon:yes stop_codon:yes gene_type:complete